MAIITLMTLEDFKKILRYVSPDSHLAVSDGVSYIWLVPMKSSKHRHYYFFKSPSANQVEEALKLLRNIGLEQIQGEVTVGKE